MTAIATSVVIVSRGRPDALLRCVTGVSQLCHPMFEIVVVADPAGLTALDRNGWTGRIRMVACDVANISVARNLGIEQAAGQIVAFIDDDAVPEPTWLTRLTAPFEASDIGAAGGFVRGRNGISYQWTARDVRPDGESRPLAVDSEKPTILTGRPGLGTKTEGTNMAFRRDVLAAAGGFDPAFRFYLDETDLNLRLAALGAQTAIVPLAQVHHGFAASDRRRGDRVPRDLHDIGASLAVFMRKHRGGDLTGRKLAEIATQRARLVRHMVAGRIEPRDVGRILATFSVGWEAGLDRQLSPLPPLAQPNALFRRFSGLRLNCAHHVLADRSFRARQCLAQARALAATGARVSVYLLSPTLRPHHIRFDSAGFWVQSGGLFGKSDRTDPPFRYWRFRDRVEREAARDSVFRSIATPTTDEH